MLGFLDIAVGRIVEVADGDLYIGPDEAGFGQARGIGDGERHVEQMREMREQGRLAAARGAEHDDVRFLDFGAVVMLIAVLHALVVVVDRDSQDLFGMVLIDDVFIEVFFYLVRLVLGQYIVELVGKGGFRLALGGGFMLVEIAVDLADAVLADSEAGIRIVDRHVILAVYFYDALAEGALVF